MVSSTLALNYLTSVRLKWGNQTKKKFKLILKVAENYLSDIFSDLFHLHQLSVSFSDDGNIASYSRNS